MPITGLQLITVTGTYLKLDGTPANGKVTFTPKTVLINTDADEIVYPVPFTVNLDGTGSFSVVLPATNDPDLTPIGWTYTVVEDINGSSQSRTFDIQIPYDTPGFTIDMADIFPAVPGEVGGGITQEDLDLAYVRTTGGGLEIVQTIANAGANVTLDLEEANVFVVQNPVESGVCTITLEGATAGRSCGCTVYFHQTASGDSELAFTGTVIPMNSGELAGPTLQPDGVAVYSLVTMNGGTTIYVWKVGESASDTPATAPNAPIGVTAVGGNAQATVTFASGGSNGSAITGYTVTSSPGGITATGASSPIVVSGLTNGTAYTFTVRATNAIGDSAESAPSSSVTPATVPGAPTIGTATLGNTTATVNWTAPASNGGSAITGYVVKLYRVSDNVEIGSATPGNVTTYQFTGLTNGVGVYGKVAAINALGTSVQSVASNAVTPASGPAVPSAPTITTATVGNTTATANWSAPSSDGGSPITGYEVKTYDSAGSLLYTDTVAVVLTFTKTGLSNGIAVKFKVAAINAIGTSAQSAFSNTVTPSAPGVVDNFNRPDENPLGTSSGGQVWSHGSGSAKFQVVSNAAKAPTVTGGVFALAHIETGLADATFTCDVNLVTAAGPEVGFVFRLVDENNFWRLLCYAGTMYLQKVVAGVNTNVGGFPTVSNSGAVTFKIVYNGSSISTFADVGAGFVAKHAVTDSALITATRVGLCVGVAAADTQSTYDNFQVVP